MKKSINVSRYHGPLIEFEVDASYLRIFSYIGLPLSLFWYFVTHNSDDFGILKSIFLICIIVNLIGLILGLIQKFTKKLIKSLSFLYFLSVSFDFLRVRYNMFNGICFGWVPC